MSIILPIEAIEPTLITQRVIVEKQLLKQQILVNQLLLTVPHR
ncbi:hypothetical protein P4S64_02520 [Vibrio sp. M60_M31a]